MVMHDSQLILSKKFRLQWEKSQQAHVLLYAEGMVQLNDSAAEVLQLCDGKRTVHEIITVLENKFIEDDIDNDVYAFLQDALEKGWVEYI